MRHVTQQQTFATESPLSFLILSKEKMDMEEVHPDHSKFSRIAGNKIYILKNFVWFGPFTPHIANVKIYATMAWVAPHCG